MALPPFFAPGRPGPPPPQPLPPAPFGCPPPPLPSPAFPPPLPQPGPFPGASAPFLQPRWLSATAAWGKFPGGGFRPSTRCPPCDAPPRLRGGIFRGNKAVGAGVARRLAWQILPLTEMLGPARLGSPKGPVARARREVGVRASGVARTGDGPLAGQVRPGGGLHRGAAGMTDLHRHSDTSTQDSQASGILSLLLRASTSLLPPLHYQLVFPPLPSPGVCYCPRPPQNISAFKNTWRQGLNLREFESVPHFRNSEEEKRPVSRWKCREGALFLPQEQELKAAADGVLSEVRKKQADTKRMVDILRALEKLRKLRKEAAARKGVCPPASADETFEHHLQRLRKLIKKRSELYEAEERALRVMLEGEQEEERKRELEKKQRKEKEKILLQKREIESKLFGDPDEFPLAHLLQPFRQYYLQAEHSLPALIQIRHDWDQYLVPSDHPEGNSVPQGWVLPPLPSNDIWATAIKLH
uniref:Programmed cell death 7 n=1 Tax=Myotis lucifugus TaxID=59463 RepID=G1Q851_MYOLU